jgi:hypothetical protein
VTYVISTSDIFIIHILFHFVTVNFNHKLCFFSTANKMNLQEVGCECVDWIYLAQDGDRWRAVINAVLNFGFHKMRGILD